MYVFALDPNTQDQNVADSLSTRRETQLALSIAFTNGLISADSLTQYSRRLDAEYQAVALNRTQVGFTHGENVFGWRFYPRFQTPDTPSNLTTLVRDQLIGGPRQNALLRDRRLEPGPRECVALVIMPSFVPYVNLDVTSNWFGLANPKRKVLDHTQAVRLSRTVRAIENCEHTVSDADCYRDGELRRLQARLNQLANRLPMQTLVTPVPVGNTLGGFEMFGNGTTDLAPELFGWYGAPGIDPNGNTTLFLVGDHFSPLRTQVIVGNRRIASPPAADQQMLSRQVVRVTIPAGVLPVMVNGRPHAQAHVATAYGVSRELLIPLAGPPPAAPAVTSAYTVAKGTTLNVRYRVTRAVNGTFEPEFAGPGDGFALSWRTPTGEAPAAVSLKLRFRLGGFAHVAPCEGAEFPVSADGRIYVSGDNLKAIALSVLASVRQHRGPLPLDPNPLAAPIEGVTVEVTPKTAGQAAPVTLDTPIRVTFTQVPCP